MPLPKPNDKTPTQTPIYNTSHYNTSTDNNTNPAHIGTPAHEGDTKPTQEDDPFQMKPKDQQKPAGKDNSKTKPKAETPDNPRTTTKTDTEPKDRHNKRYHAIAQHEVKEIIGKLTPKQSNYILARLIDPSWTFKACSSIADSKTASTQMERQIHVARILKAAKANREGLNNLSQGDTFEADGLSREEALSILARIARDCESGNKDVMEAIKQFRDLEDWDKGGKAIVGALAAVLAALPMTSMLASASPSLIPPPSPITLPNLTQDQ
jgi:hypothetical protein